MTIKKCILDIETAGFDPTQHRIICIGIKDLDSGKTVAFRHEDEEKMLRGFLSHFKSEDFKEIIGFNTFFDFRFIFAKCLKYELESKVFFTAHVVDIMMILKSVKKAYNFNKPGTLDSWLRFVFGEGKLCHNGDIPQMYEDGEIEEIIEYNQHEIELISKLWERIKFVLGWGQ